MWGSCCRIALSFAAISLVGISTTSQALETHVVAVSGQSVPGVDGAYFTWLDPYCNASSPNGEHRMFAGIFDGPGTTDADRGAFFTYDASGIHLAFRLGQELVGSGLTYASGGGGGFQKTGNDGRFATQVTVAGPGVTSDNDTVCLSGHGVADLTIVGREGDAAPGTASGVTFWVFGSLMVGGTGRITGTAMLHGAPNETNGGIWTWAPGDAAMAKIHQLGDPAPGTPAGVTFGRGPMYTMNDSGQYLITNVLVGTGVTTNNDSGLWRGQVGSSVNLVVREGQTAPGLADAQYGELYTVTNNNQGQFAVATYLHSSNSLIEGARAVYTGDNSGNLNLLIGPGQSAPGTAYHFGGAVGPLAINANGVVAVGTALGTDWGIWTGSSPADLALVAYSEDQAPGTAAGVRYGSVGSIGLSINQRGQIAFPAVLDGVGVTADNDNALFLYDPEFGTQLVVRQGEAFQVAAGDVRIVSDFSGRMSSDPPGLGDDGRLFYTVSFTDGTSGEFVTSVPEPGSTSLLALGIVALLRRARHIRRSR